MPQYCSASKVAAVLVFQRSLYALKRMRLLVKAERREQLGGALRDLLRYVEAVEVPRRAIAIDVDPMHLM